MQPKLGVEILMVDQEEMLSREAERLDVPSQPDELCLGVDSENFHRSYAVLRRDAQVRGDE